MLFIRRRIQSDWTGVHTVRRWRVPFGAANWRHRRVLDADEDENRRRLSNRTTKSTFCNPKSTRRRYRRSASPGSRVETKRPTRSGYRTGLSDNHGGFHINDISPLPSAAALPPDACTPMIRRTVTVFSR